MRDLDRALADIGAIRAQLERGTVFHGLGPAMVGSTGLLALLAACVQSAWFGDTAIEPAGYFGWWFATALLALGLIGAEAVLRSRRLYSRLADQMLYNAAEQFLPPAATGVLLAVVFFRCTPESLWLLPGLWQVLIGLGIFSAARSLPRAVSLAGGWYVLAGLGTLVIASPDHALSPWIMGVPFGVGQILFAGILHWALGGGDGES